MTNEGQAGPSSLRQAASEWFAVMRGPNAQKHRSEFERWLAEDPSHRTAYNRIAEVFSLGKGLAPPEPDRQPSRRPVPIARFAQAVMIAALVAAATGFIIKLGMPVYWFGVDGPAIPRPVHDTYYSGPGELRSFSLADGTLVTLDRDSRIAVSMTALRRDVQLVRGRARFAVAHEARPFAVGAGSGTVIARGTLFDVALRNGTQNVITLIEGIVDVELPGRAPGESKVVRRLEPGHELRFAEGKARPVGITTAHTAQGATNWANHLRDFDDVSLRQLLDDANRINTAPIRLATSDLAALRVSGTFRVDDNRKLALNLAEILGLTATETAGGFILSQACRDHSQKNCARPS